LSQFKNDWATEEIVKQYIKNKQRNHYAHGWLEVPKKYTYLKQNSSKQDSSGSWSKKALSGMLIARAQKRQVAMGSTALRVVDTEIDRYSTEGNLGMSTTSSRTRKTYSHWCYFWARY